VTQHDFLARRRLLVGDLSEQKLDAMVIAHGPNVRYLTGFTGSNALLLLFGEDGLLFTDPRYRIQAAEETGCKVKVARGSLLADLVKTVQRRKIRRLGFEKNRLSFDSYEILDKGLPLSSSLEPLVGLVELRRMIKSEEEIALIRRSAKVNSKAFSECIRRIRPGVREADLAMEFEYRMRKLGAERPAFETIVASGERSALPHAQPSAKTFEQSVTINGHGCSPRRLCERHDSDGLPRPAGREGQAPLRRCA
jgi:Xaa-Pro aminopeptidase